MSKDNDNEIARRQPEGSGLIVRREQAASAASLARVAAALERANTMGDLVRETTDSTVGLCLDLVMALEPISEAKLPQREAKNPNADPYDSTSSRSFSRPGKDSHLKILSPEVAAVLQRYDQLGFSRVRCYVRTGRASIKVATYDLMIPTWNGAMLYNPADSWGGSERQWLGFRPATGPTDIAVISAAALPLTTTDKSQIPDRANYNVYSSEGFHWAKVDPEWQVSYKPDLAICKLFIQQTKNLLTEVSTALDTAINGLRDVLKTARGDHLLQLDSDGDSGAPAAPPATNERATGRDNGAAAQPQAPKRPGFAGPEDVDIVS